MDDIIIMEYDSLLNTVTFSVIFGRDKKKRIKVREENKTWYGGKKIVQVEKEIIYIKKGTTKRYKPIRVAKNGKYNLCVMLHGYGSSVELTSFEISNGVVNKNGNDDNFNDDEFKVKSFPILINSCLLYIRFCVKLKSDPFKHEKNTK